MKCGKTIPDLEARLPKRQWNKWWFLPIAAFVVAVITIIGFTFYLDRQTVKATELYREAENLLMEEHYDEATDVLQDALKHRKDFSPAAAALEYANEALQIENQLKEAEQLLAEKDYQSAIALLHESEDKLNRFQGPLVTMLVDKIDAFHADARLQKLEDKIAAGPSINEIRVLIWEADEINHPDTEEIAELLRNQLVDYTFSKASEALNEKQFNDALLITEDGLKYAPESEKLQSLLANINKEKHSFESAQKERMEQAMDTAYEEYQINENAAIELIDVDVENDGEDQIVIKGRVESIATVPIHSIIVEYTLSRNGEDFLSNEIYVYPDVLYPGEEGRFEFTHFDLKDDSSRIDVEVKRITWYTD